MSKIIQAIENEQLKKDIPDFKAGDTIVVQSRVKEGNRERLQAFEGIVIAKKNRGINSSFIVRKISHGEGVERTFQTHSPLIASIKIKRKGDVRRAKLYYLRKLSGRAARIKEKIGRKKTTTETTTEKSSLPAEEPEKALPIAEEVAVKETVTTEKETSEEKMKE